MKKITSFWMVLLALMSGITSTKAQIANAQCNQVTPFTSANFNGLSVSSSQTWGVNNFSNLNNQIDSNLANYSTAGGFIGVDSSVRVTDSNDVYPAGTYAGYDFDIVNISLVNFGTVTLYTYKAGVQQESQAFTANNLIEVDGRKRVGFKTTKSFDAIQLRYQSASLGIPTINAFYPFIIKFCQSPELVVNVMTPINSTTFATYINEANTGVSGLSIGSVTNADNAVDANTSNFASLTNLASIAGQTKLSVKDGSKVYNAGTFAGFDVENANLISISAFSNVTIKTYLNGVLQEQKTGPSLWIGAPLFDFQNRWVIGFETTKNFDEVQIEVNQPLGGTLGTTKVYSAVLKKPGEGPALACNTPTAFIEPNYPVNINSQRTGVAGLFALGYQVTEPDNVIDQNPDNYASLTVPATIGSSASLSVLKSLSDFPAGTYAGFDIAPTTLLSIDFLKNITIKTYNNGVLKESVSGNGIILGVNSDIIASSGRYVLGFVTTQAFDEVQISVNNVLGLNLGTTKVYKMVVMNPCAKTINCNSSYYLKQPDFPVVLNAERTGMKTVGCVGCSVNNPDNVIDNNPNNNSRITVAAGVLNSGSISVVDPTATYPVGTFAGFTVKDRYFIVQGDLFEYITVKTYNNGVLQESKTSFNLLDLSLLIPIWGTGTKNVGFYTTKPFNEIQIEAKTITSLANIIDVYGAFIDTRSSNGGSLSCAVTIDAVNDTFALNGSTSTNVLANDTVAGAAATLQNVTLTQVSTSNPAVNLNTTTGNIEVAAGTAAGTYNVVYKICATASSTSCDTATASITVSAPAIVAVTETFTGITSGTGGTTASVLSNDTLGGQPATTSNVNLTGTTVPTGLTLNNDGTITVAAGKPAGTYDVTYQICDKVNTSNCANVTSKVTVSAPAIVATTETFTGISSTNGGTTASVLANDTLGGQPATTSNVNLTGTTIPTGLTLNNDGTITVAAGTPAGTYDVTYQICDKVNTANCATVTSKVTVSAPAIVAASETLTPTINNQTGGTTSSSALSNDTLGGVPVLPNQVMVTTINAPAGITMNSNGTISVAPNTPAGTYGVAYRICDVINPANCSNAIATVTVSAPAIVATTETFTGISSTTGGTTASVLANDTLGGQPATTSNVNLTGTTVPTGLTLNNDGTITVAAGKPAGTYDVTYQICDKVNTSNCANVVSKVTVSAPAIAIDAVNDNLTVTAGTTSTASVLANDILNGLPATTATVTLVQVSSSNSGITLNTSTGQISVANTVALGNYTLTYQITDTATGTATDTATVTIEVKGITDLKASIGSSRTTLSTGVPTQLIYTITNVGTAATDGSIITVNLYKPLNTPGTMTSMVIPSDWTLVGDMGTYIQYKSNKIIGVGEAVVFSYEFTRTVNVTGITTIRTQIINGSGGDTVTTNNLVSQTLTHIN